MAIMYYAASKVGLVPVPLNYRLADKEWEYIINDSASKLIIARKSEYVSRIDGISSDLKSIKKFVSIDADDKRQNWEDFYSWIGNHDGSKPDIDVNDEDDVYQMYTSGTTGHPKGAVLLQRNVSENTRQYLHNLTLPIPSRTHF